MIRPAYWTDSDLHTRLTAEQREFYIGLDSAVLKAAVTSCG